MIAVENLSFHYNNNITIFESITSELAPGHIYGLLGLNGIGKTTLLKLLSGALFPKTGVIRINGIIPSERSTPFLSDVYFVTDEVDLPDWTIADICSIYSPLYPKFDLVYFESLLTSFQVDNRENIKDLSYGQRKKVNIAFALASNVSLLLMDEPTNGLDIPAKTQFRKIIAKHISDDKIIIISTHQIRDIHHLIDHLLILKKHKLVLDKSIYELGKVIKFVRNSHQQALYTENHIDGDHHILANDDQEDSPFDIELFFNAIHENPTFLNQIKQIIPQSHA
ncbi:ATP-binding cassette domain-containing protein [Sphingobacterium suaedae]|uniref:ATP-binding cassette domain-containing protein n=1 Tax=Sphingobacterium suaedae TaxID=1686402 RepID=A0ABW5KGV3_9SPHI